MKEKPLFSRPAAGGEQMQEIGSGSQVGRSSSLEQISDMAGSGYALKKRAQAARISKIDAYDFTQTEKFSPDQWRIINRMAIQFAEQLSPKLTPLLQSRVIVEFWEVRSLSFREYVDFLPAPTPMAIFQVDIESSPTQSIFKGMWVLDSLLAFLLVERLMGGRGEPNDEIRELSQIEQAVLRKNLFAKVMETWIESWKNLGNLQTHLDGLEFEPQQVFIVPYAEAMVVFAFRMKVGIIEGVWELALPFKFLKQNLLNASFEDYLSKSLGTKPIDQIPSSLFSKKIEVGKLPVSVEIGRAEIPFQDLLTLEEGDIICLDTKLGTSLKIMVSGRTKFMGKPGLRDNKYAVQITNVVDEGEEGYEE